MRVGKIGLFSGHLEQSREIPWQNARWAPGWTRPVELRYGLNPESIWQTE